MIKKVFLFVLLLTFVQSCTKESTSPKIDKIKDVLVPLDVGNYWVYEINDIFYNIHKIDTIRVSRDTTLLNKRWFVLNKDWYLHEGGRYGFDFHFFTNEQDGLYNFLKVNSNLFTSIFLKYPTVVGSEWQGRVGQYLIYNIEVISVSEDLITYLVTPEVNYPSTRWYIRFRPNVGMESLSTDTNFSWKWVRAKEIVLKDYKLY